MNKYMLIMAGGSGTRFWPLSRRNSPKQFLNLSGNDAMINETIKRCQELIPPEHTYIVTNKQQADALEKILLPIIPKENILVEPVGRNTAPCILYAAMHIQEKHGDGVLCVFPSDHVISEGERFLAVLDKAINVAGTENKVVTLGIKPVFPSTGYGYIKRGKNTVDSDVFELERFVEKPNAERAREYIESGNYYWNSGMFIWNVSLAIELNKRFLPRLYRSFQEVLGKLTKPEGQELLANLFPRLESISVDYGIMERVDDALVIPGDFGWSDVGSWDSLGSVLPMDAQGNIVKANHLGVDTKECIVYGTDKLIATVGLYNTVIVETPDAILVCAKEKSHDVKFIVDQLNERGMSGLL